MNLELITIIANYILITLTLVYGYKVLNKFATSYNKKNKEELDLLKISMGNSIEEVNTIIDTIISESISEFVIINNIQNSKYIGTDLENEIRQNVMESVSNRMSSVLFNRLRLFYRDDSIPDIIAKKIFLAVSIYTSNNNNMNTKK